MIARLLTGLATLRRTAGWACMCVPVSVLLISETSSAHAFPTAQQQAALGSVTAQTQGPAARLELGKPLERELKGGESHEYTVKVAAGQFVYIVVDQRGVDVIVRFFDPDGKQITESDSPIGDYGPEPVSAIAAASGEYRLRVQALNEKAAPGRYEVKLSDLRAPTARDRTRIAAERAFMDGNRLLGTPTAESYSAACKKFEIALPLWREAGDQYEEALTISVLGNVYGALGDAQKGLVFLNQSLPMWRTLGRQRETGQELFNIGVANSSLPDYPKAIEYFQQALVPLRAVGNRVREAETLRRLGVAYYNQKDFKKSVEQFEHALPIYRQLADKAAETETLNSITALYDILGDQQKALEYAMQVPVSTGASRKPELVLQAGHADHIRATTISPDGRWLASGGSDGLVKLWEAKAGFEVRTFVGHKAEVVGVAFSPDGRRLLSGSFDNTVKIWDLATGREICTLNSQARFIERVAFSADGHWVALASFNGAIEVWDMATGTGTRILSGHKSDLFALAFSRDSRLLASGDASTVKVWDLASGKEVRTFSGEFGIVQAVAFSPNGSMLASGGGDDVIHLWDLTTGNELLTLKGHTGHVTALAFSPDGRRLASGSGFPQFLGASEGSDSVATITFGGRFEGKGKDNSVRLWDATSGFQIGVLTGHTDTIGALCFSPDGRKLISGSYDDSMKIWDIGSLPLRELQTVSGRTTQVGTMALSPDGRRLASSMQDYPAVKIWDFSTGRDIKTLRGHSGEVTALAYSLDGQTLATGSWDKTIKLWDAATGRELYTLAGHSEAVTSVKFAPSGRFLASASSKQKRLWEVATGKELSSLPIPDELLTLDKPSNVPCGAGSAEHLVFSRDGKRAAFTDEKAIKLCDVESGKELHSLATPAPDFGVTYFLAFSPDSHWLAAGNGDDVLILDVASGQLARKLSGHTGWVESLAFAPDGRWLASGSMDGTTRIWDPATGEQLVILLAMRETNDWLVITPDGLFDGSVEGTRKLVAWRFGSRVFPPDKFYTDFQRPDLLKDLLAGERPKPKIDLASLKLPPDVRISSPESGTQPKLERTTVIVEVTDNGGGVSQVLLKNNGKTVEKLTGKPGNKSTYSFDVELASGDNFLSAVALSSERVESNEDVARLVYNEAEPMKPTLHILAIGISKYRDSDYELDFARKDADAITAFFRSHARLFEKVSVVELADEKATQDAITVALNQLVADARPEDVVLIYYAGHGVALEQQFYLLPYEMCRAACKEEDEESAFRKYGLPVPAIGEAMVRIKAQKQILILDACQSEGALKILAKQLGTRGGGGQERKLLEALARSSGFVLIAASTKQQAANEAEELGHGILTFALLTGLGEKGPPEAPMNKDGAVTAMGLMLYVQDRVPELTAKYREGKRQSPAANSIGQDFPLILK